jgi:amino acid transporter
MHSSVAGGSERPRELRWYHAAGLLFGDWGTSRLYVLGLAFVMSAHASFWYVAAMCALVALVGFSYSIICAHFPDGGGVYSAARKRSPLLGVVGALLLIANYTVTASLSAYEGFRYMLPSGFSPDSAWWMAVAALIPLGCVNIIGARRVGLAAVGIAIVAAVFYLIIAVFCVAGAQNVVIEKPVEPFTVQWRHFVNVILALSGVEAIATMTGVMAEPVKRNSRLAIFVVLAEVVVLNLVLAYALHGLPELQGATAQAVPGSHETVLVDAKGVQFDAARQTDLQDHAVKILAEHYVSPTFAAVASFFFGLLLLSAANTAIGGMVSVFYLLARDKELPSFFTSLNSFGVPKWSLLMATGMPILVLMAVYAYVGADGSVLAGLYAIGVVGAIAINLTACGTNWELDFKKWERASVLSVGILVCVIELTIAYYKPDALLFAGLIMGTGLIARHAVHRRKAQVEAEKTATQPSPARALVSGERPTIPANMPRVLVPSRGNPKLLKFAVNYAKTNHAAVFVLFVREISLAFRERGGKVAAENMTLANDAEAQRIFADVKKRCDEAGVPMMPLYAVSDNPAELILDHAATLGVDAVLMGVSQRSALWKTLKGDVLQEVISHLPESIPLLIHA